MQIQAYMISTIQNVKRLVKASSVELKSFLEKNLGISSIFGLIKNKNIGFSTSRLTK
jgi:hypothetical protein